MRRASSGLVMIFGSKAVAGYQRPLRGNNKNARVRLTVPRHPTATLRRERAMDATCVTRQVHSLCRGCVCDDLENAANISFLISRVKIRNSR